MFRTYVHAMHTGFNVCLCFSFLRSFIVYHRFPTMLFDLQVYLYRLVYAIYVMMAVLIAHCFMKSVMHHLVNTLLF